MHERKFLFFREAGTGSNGECVFNFWRNCKLFTNVTVQFTFPPAIYEGPSFSMSSSTLGSVDLFHYSHSTRQVVVFHCGIICTFLMTLNSFPCVYLPSVYLLCWSAYSKLVLIFFIWLFAFLLSRKSFPIIKSFLGYMIYKYFLLAVLCIFLNGLFQKASF